RQGLGGRVVLLLRGLLRLLERRFAGLLLLRFLLVVQGGVGVDVGVALVAFQRGLGFGLGGCHVLLLGGEFVVGLRVRRIAAGIDGLLARGQVGGHRADGVERIALALVGLHGLVLGALGVGAGAGVVGHALAVRLGGVEL